MNKKTILIVDDNKKMQLLLYNSLKEQGYGIITASDGLEALKEVEKYIPDLVLLDMRLPGMNGIQVLKKMREIDEDLIIIMITAYGDIKSSVTAMKSGAYDYITKPFNYDELSIIIKKALKTRDLSREVKDLRQRLLDKTKTDFVLGESPQIQKVLKKVEIIAPTNMSVIIYGESGTGKEVFANIIHKKSLRKDKPFIPVDCGAIPNSLFESELFGHEKGAFTGANNSKKGDFELADKGTLFLDEISNLSLEAQAKLLRVLEGRKIKRIGGTKFQNIDVRIIIASNINLAELVDEGKFRYDLFHRLNEFFIALPLLSERKDDIPILAKEFLKEANKEFGKNIIDLNSEVMKYLLSHTWNGNVRELKHTIKRAVLLEESDYLTLSALESEIAQPQFNMKNVSLQTLFQNIFKEGVTLQEIKTDLSNKTEKEIIKKVLTEVKYNKSKAAGILGIDRKTLYSKMKILGIE